MGLHPNPYNSAVYMGTMDGERVFIGIYVDDMPVLAETVATVIKIKSLIAEKYEIKDLGEIQYILGIHVTHYHANCHLMIS